MTETLLGLLAAYTITSSIVIAWATGKMYKELDKLEAGLRRLELEGIYKNEIDYEKGK